MDAGHHHCATKQSWLRQSTGTSDTGMVRSTAKDAVPLFQRLYTYTTECEDFIEFRYETWVFHNSNLPLLTVHPIGGF